MRLWEGEEIVGPDHGDLPSGKVPMLVHRHEGEGPGLLHQCLRHASTCRNGTEKSVDRRQGDSQRFVKVKQQSAV